MPHCMFVFVKEDNIKYIGMKARVHSVIESCIIITPLLFLTNQKNKKLTFMMSMIETVSPGCGEQSVVTPWCKVELMLSCIVTSTH